MVDCVQITIPEPLKFLEPDGKTIGDLPDFARDRDSVVAMYQAIVLTKAFEVLSDQFELVSARTVRLILMPHRDRATQPERRRG